MKTGAGIVNGHRADALAIGNRGLQYGDGLFETVAVVGGQALLWERHWTRLVRDCGRLQLSPPREDAVLAAMDELALAPVCAVKIIVARAAQARGYRPSGTESDWIVTAHPFEPPAQERRSGIMATWCNVRLSTPNACAGMKTLNRLEQVLAQREWRPPVREGLMQDPAGLVIEGTMSNLFIVEAGRLVTPPLAECGITGVMRAAVMDAAAGQAIAVAVEPLTRARVEGADEIFLTNSLIGIWPVRDLAGQSFSAGPVSQRLLAVMEAQGDVATA